MADDFSDHRSFISRNKVWLAIGIFLVLIIFVDENNLFRRVAIKHEIKAVQEEIDDKCSQIEKNELLLRDLDDDSLVLEHIAREKYHMSRDDEDVFIER